jgi:cytoskeletal protein RodZ
MGGLGEELRAAREARNLSLSDVSERIHIRTVYLQGLEEEDWGSIAAPVYVRGFLRTYARFLGLDPEDVVARFNAAIPVVLPQGNMRFVGTRTRRGPSVWLWLVTAVALVLVAFVAYDYYELQREQPVAVVAPMAERQATAAPPAMTPSPARSPGTPPEVANGVAVRLVARSWLRVAVDGSIPMEGIYPAGTQRVFRGKTVTVRAGNAAGVDIRVNGRDTGTLGAPGDVVERTYRLAQE